MGSHPFYKPHRNRRSAVADAMHGRGGHETLGHRSALVEKEMFGGICFLFNGNICVGIRNNNLIVRTGADAHEETLSQPHSQEFDITGRTMQGWAMIEPTAIYTCSGRGPKLRNRMPQ